jgi:nucleotide-binding universal stress UspA family protein
MIRKILIPLDRSAFAEQALETGATLARRCGATLTLLHVVPSLEVDFRGANNQIVPVSSVLEHFEDTARDYLEEHARKLRAKGIPVTSEVKIGHAAETILHTAHEHAFDLLIMTTHGRGALSRMFKGSVADAVSKRLPRAMLLIRPQSQ